MASVSSSTSPVAATAAKSAAAEASPHSTRGRLLKYPSRPLGIQSRLLVSLDLLLLQVSFCWQIWPPSCRPPQRQNPQFCCSLVQGMGGVGSLPHRSYPHQERRGWGSRGRTPQVVGEEEVFKGAQVWKFSSRGFFLFFYHKASMGRRL